MNDREKDLSIEYILSQGLVKPKTARGRIVEMTRSLGFRFIFWDTGYGLLFAAVTIAAALFIFGFTPDKYRFAPAVVTAPLMFLLLALFSESAERVSGLFELKQTCRYTVSQITALRVICYSAAGVALTAVTAAIGTESLFRFISLFTLCLSALFVCAVFSLYVTRFGKWANAAFTAVWVVSLTLPLMFGERWESLLRAVPIAVSAALALTSAIILVVYISKMLTKVKKYAVA